VDKDSKVEEPYSFKIEKITGAHGENSASGVFRRRLTFGDGERGGELVSCILIAGEAGGDLGVVLGDIFELAIKRLEDSGEDILESLQLALESGREYGAGKALEVSFIHCFFYKDACFVCRLGDKVSLLSFNRDKTGAINVQLGSGPIVDGQIFLVATRKFLDIFDRDSLKTEKIDLGEIIDGLATQISDLAKQSEIGAVFIQAKALAEKEEKESKAIEETEGVGEIGEGDEIKEVEADEKLDVREAPKERLGSKLKIKNPLPAIFRILVREISRLRSGDLRAIFRLRRNIVLLSAVVILVLVGSGAYTLYGQNQKTKISQLTEHLASAKSKYSEALAILAINQSRARTLLVDADNEVKAALAVDSKNTDVNNLKDEISAKLKETEAATSVKLETLSEFAENTTGVAFNGKNLVVVHGNKLSTVNLVDKKTSDIDLGESVKSAVVYSNNAFVLEDAKIKKVDLVSEKVKEVASEGGADIDVFFGNVYSLRASGIRKFVPIENGYSGSDYLSNKVDFAPSSRMTIDSSVWVTKDDKILKFTRGKQETYEISGLVNANFKLGAIYTNADVDNLYVVDSANSVLLVIDKKGVYKKVYQGAEFAKVADLVVDEAGGKMYLAVGNKILTAPL